ncbi:MAG: hypothetical protein WDN02_03070 [Methylovirgula sp.]|uniref:hypothetical protein n=1 Tax=Methylovirgula sp. TaxID=1978224 RepID=UPI0030765ECC
MFSAAKYRAGRRYEVFAEDWVSKCISDDLIDVRHLIAMYLEHDLCIAGLLDPSFGV